MTLKTIKELEADKTAYLEDNGKFYDKRAYKKALKDVLEVIDERIKELESEIKASEKLIERADKTPLAGAFDIESIESLKIQLKLLEELKARINGK